MNVCILLGRLKDDPVIRRHSSGNDVATLVIEEVVVHRDRGSGAPVERTVNHQVRVYNQSFVNAAKAEGARGRHVEVHGALSYAEDGQAFVSVPPHGGRLAFKSFEVREIPHEPPPVVADHEAARDLAAAVPEPVAPALPDLGRPPERVRQDQEVGQPSAPAVDRATTDEGADRAPSDELVPQTGRTTVAARPPQIGVGRPSLVGGRSAPAQPPATTGQVRPPVQARMPGSVPNPPPTRPSVGGGAARTSAPSAGGAVAGVAQPRTPVPQRNAGPIVRPTSATRPPLAQPAAAAVGTGGGKVGGGLGRATVAAPAVREKSGRTWGSTTMDDSDLDVPF